MKLLPLLATLVAGLALVLRPAGSLAEEPDAPFPPSHTERIIEGWTVRVDDRLLSAPNEALGGKAIRLLEAELADIASIVPEAPLKQLRATPIVLDLNNGKLRNMQYHPSTEWLVQNGYAQELAKCVHVPSAAYFTAPRHHHEQPWCILHELAHAYHDQKLGFDEPRIRRVWEQYKASGHGESVLHIGGRRTRHYALTDQKEFFAEMSESYFGMNDFFPFNRAELKEAEPEIYALLKETWGIADLGSRIAD